MLAHFGEPFSKELCNSTCDNCRRGNEFNNVDCTDFATTLLRGLEQFGQRFTRKQLANVVLGSLSASVLKRVPEVAHDPCYGCAKSVVRAKADAERLINQLFQDGLLREQQTRNGAGYYNQYVALGDRRAVRGLLQGRRRFTPRLLQSKTKAKAAKRRRTQSKAASGAGDFEEDEAAQLEALANALDSTEQARPGPGPGPGS